MFKRYFLSALALAACAVMPMLSTGCSGGGKDSTKVKSYSDFDNVFSAEKFLSGNATVIITTGNGVILNVRCNKGKYTKGSYNGGTAVATSGYYDGVVEFSGPFNLVYSAKLAIAETDYNGKKLTIEFEQCRSADSRATTGAIRDILHVSDAASLGTGGTGSRAGEETPADGDNAAVTSGTWPCELMVTMILEGGVATHALEGGKCNMVTSRWFADRSTAAALPDAAEWGPYNWAQKTLTGTYTVNVAL